MAAASRALMYPYDISLLHMIMHKFPDFEIIEVASPNGWGYVGKDAGSKIGIETGIIVKHEQEIEFNQIEKLFLMPSIISLDDKCFRTIIDKAKSLNIEIIDMRNNGNDVCLKRDDKLYGTEIKKIDKPVVLVIGTGDRTNKFDIQLIVRECFQKKGYTVSQIGTKGYCEYLGFHSFPNFMYSNLQVTDRILGFNHYIYELSKSENADVTLPANEFTAPSGKQFKGWSLTTDGAIVTKVDMTENRTVYAIWENIPVVTYTVSFAANGGTGTMADVTGISGEYTLPANGFTAPAGKQFKAWSVGGVEKAVGDKITVTANTTVTAVWEAIEYNVTVTGGTASVGAGTPITKATMGTTVTLTANAAPSGKVFDKWEVVSGGITLADANSATTTFTMPASTVSVKATYKNAPHTHTYNQETVKPEALKTPADCTHNAVYFKSCSCGAISTTDTFVAMNTALGHAYGSDWKYDSTNHWHECSRCHDKKDEAAHSASEWIIDTAATETAEGAKHKECTVCKKVLETATIPATGSSDTPSYGVYVGMTYTAGNFIYQITSIDTATVGQSKVIGVVAAKKNKIKKVTIPDRADCKGYRLNVTAVGDNAFAGCKALKKLTIGNKVTVIGKNAFKKCSKLETVVIGKAVKTISSKAFIGDNKIKKITFKGKKLKTVNKNAFSKKVKKNIKSKKTKLKGNKKAIKLFKKKLKIK